MSRGTMDRYYRAVKRFREELSGETENKKLRTLLKKTDRATEHLDSVYYDVHIDPEWVSTIERAVPHLEAAIREDRQFIKSEGNIAPIERVRKVSRASVEHLARHSEMITHMPDDGEDLMPDRLKVYENESNFAVYENRVLYMVLCYTRDFVDYRFRLLSKLWDESGTEMSFSKKLRYAGRDLAFEMRLVDKTPGISEEAAAEAELLARIEALSGSLSVLLSMPLMREAALAPMATPPITRTNVLRMDVHFREVVALYDYLSSYTGDGYTFEEYRTAKSPFSDALEEDVDELILYSMYLSACHSRELTEELEKHYQEDERLREEEERKLRAKKVEELRAHASDAKSLVEYTLALQERVKELSGRIEELNTSLSEADVRLQSVYETEERERALIDELGRTKEAMHAEVKKASHLANEERLKSQELRAQLSAKDELLSSLKESERYASARVKALLSSYAGIENENALSDREQFLELEKEREAFLTMFERQWGEAKKKIRKRALWGRSSIR